MSESMKQCPHAQSDITPCYLKDGEMCLSEPPSSVCVGCNRSLKELQGVACDLCGDDGPTARRRSREHESVFGLGFIYVCVDEAVCEWRPRLNGEDEETDFGNVVPLHPEPVGVSHLVGPVINFRGFVRQRCTWCGVALVDVNLSLIAVAPGDDGEPSGVPLLTWSPGRWLRIVPGNPEVMSIIEHEEGHAPEDSCMLVCTCEDPG